MTKQEVQNLFTHANRIYIVLSNIKYNKKDSLPVLMIWVEDGEGKLSPVFCEESKYWDKSVGGCFFSGGYLMDDWGSDAGGRLLYELGIRVCDVFKVVEFWNGYGKLTYDLKIKEE